MITKDEIIEIGRFLKPHGIKGEIAFAPDFEELDLTRLFCIVVNRDGIFVPFFVNAVRPKGNDTLLVSIHGIRNETAAATLGNTTVYALRSDVEIDENEGNAEGFQAHDFIGFMAVDADNNNQPIGIIENIDNTTDNWLFVLSEIPHARSGGDETKNYFYIPVADEFITQVDVEGKILGMSLPHGLLETVR